MWTQCGVGGEERWNESEMAHKLCHVSAQLVIKHGLGSSNWCSTRNPEGVGWEAEGGPGGETSIRMANSC